MSQTFRFCSNKKEQISWLLVRQQTTRTELPGRDEKPQAVWLVPQQTRNLSQDGWCLNIHETSVRTASVSVGTKP
jgi:hypothetical protein